MSLFVLQVKELLNRNLDAVEIARRLHASNEQVNQAITMLS